MSLKEIKAEYKNQIINKPEYISKIHKIHECLFEYAEFIKNTDIAEIQIIDDTIIMTSRTTGIKLVCDKEDERNIPIEILNFDYYEKNDFDMMIKLIEEDYTVLDIGANIGWYTINMCKLKKDVNILAFEPIPKTFAYLKRNLEINGIYNIRVFNFGFSNEEKESIFYYCAAVPGNASLANLTGSDNVEKIQCNMKTIDGFVNENNIKVDFIKCDVEGAELLVFEGGIETLKTHKPIIFAEMLRKWSTKFGYHPNDIIRLLMGMGYKCFTVKDEALLEFFYMDEYTIETNFFFLHAEKHEAKININCLQKT